MTVRPVKTQISLCIRPIWSVFAVRMKKHWVLNFPLSAHQRLWSESSLSSNFVGFVMRRLKWCMWATSWLNLSASFYCMTTFMMSDPPVQRRSRIRVWMLFVKAMNIMCAIFCHVRKTCLVTRLAHANDSVVTEDDRLLLFFFQDRVHVLMYGKPYCIIGIKHDFPFINIRKVPREVLKTEGEAPGFQISRGILRMLMNDKIMFDRYYHSKKTHRKLRKCLRTLFFSLTTIFLRAHAFL